MFSLEPVLEDAVQLIVKIFLLVHILVNVVLESKIFSLVNLLVEGGCTTVSCNTGGGNIAIGQSASKDITTGYHNIAIGNQALCTNSTSGCNIGLGFCAGLFVTGAQNTFIGRYAGVGCSQASATGSYNVAIDQALRCVTSNSSSIAIGLQASVNVILVIIILPLVHMPVGEVLLLVIIVVPIIFSLVNMLENVIPPHVTISSWVNVQEESVM